MRTNGADCLSFRQHSRIGKQEQPSHGMPSDKKIEQGDFITLTMAARSADTVPIR